jgi:hypothetical protein
LVTLYVVSRCDVATVTELTLHEGARALLVDVASMHARFSGSPPLSVFPTRLGQGSGRATAAASTEQRRAAPGSLIVLLIGLKVTGLAGAAQCSRRSVWWCMRSLGTGSEQPAPPGARWCKEHTLAPVTVRLTFASGRTLMRGTEHGLLPCGVTIISAAWFSLTEITRFLLLATGAGALLLVGGK